MPGAVYVKRSASSVEISSIPKPYGERFVVASLWPDYHLSVPAGVQILRHGRVKPLSAKVPGAIICHFSTNSDPSTSSSTLATLPKGT